jgi:hypothetical protein
MIPRPAWEKPLRRRLKRHREKTGVPAWLREYGFLTLILTGFHFALVAAGVGRWGPAGGGTAAGLLPGVVGALLAMYFRNKLQVDPWLTTWTPATDAVARRVRLRETLRPMGWITAGVLAVAAWAGSIGGAPWSVSAGGAALGMASGFLLAGGREPVVMLCLGALWCLGYTVVTGVIFDDPRTFNERVLAAAVIGWPPVLPWALATHDTAAPGFHLALLAVMAALSGLRWWQALRPPVATPVESDLALMRTESEEEDPPAAAGESEAPAESEPVSEDRRREVRQNVAFGWYGLAGYLPQFPLSRLDRWTWRWLTPRERQLSAVGSQEAALWIHRTRWTAAALAAMALLAWLPYWLSDSPEYERWSHDYSFWYFMAHLGLAAIALVSGAPAKLSRFQVWLEPMQAQGLGFFATLSMLPVTTSEWSRAVAKEWSVRAAWLCLLWSLTIGIALPAVAPEAGLAAKAAALLLPWLAFAGWFPLSLLNRQVRAISGRAFAEHGFTRVVPALMCGVVCAIAAAGVSGAIATGHLDLAAAAGVTAAASGAACLRLARSRMAGMGFDMKPKIGL